MKKIHCLLSVLPAFLLAACANVPPEPTVYDPAVRQLLPNNGAGSVTPTTPTAPNSPTAPGGASANVAAAPVTSADPCARPVDTPALPPPAQPPVQAASFADLPGWDDDDVTAAWPAFQRSCSGLKPRPVWQHWQAVCEAASAVPATDHAAIRSFFESRFQPWALTLPDGGREGTITGYYEPILKGSLSRSDKAKYPVLSVPEDMYTIDLGELYPELKKFRLRGRIEGNKVVPYFPRADIRKREGNGLPSRPLAWVEDPVELFFLHIQGSGRIALPGGNQLRVGYADQNGHPYQSIGKALIERGELKLEQASMQGIQAWVRANPDKLDELLNVNPSFVFFRELPPGNDGPPGALGVPLLAERALAIDPRSTPLGAPVFLATTQANSTVPLNRLMMAQDTGGAIKGVVRADFYYGTGPEAGQKAGRMKQKGRMWVLLPKTYPVADLNK